MIKTNQISQISVGRNTANAILSGHPWVFGENRKGYDLGQLVEFTSEKGAVVGWGLVGVGPISHRVLGRGPMPKSGFEATIRERLFSSTELCVFQADVICRRAVYL